MHPPCKGQVPHRSTHCNVEGRIAVVLWCLQPRQNILAHSLRWAGTRHDGRGHPNQECRQFPKRAFWKNPMQHYADPAWNTDATTEIQWHAGLAGGRAAADRGRRPRRCGGGGPWHGGHGRKQQARNRPLPAGARLLGNRPDRPLVPSHWDALLLVCPSLPLLLGGRGGGSSRAVNPPPPSFH